MGKRPIRHLTADEKGLVARIEQKAAELGIANDSVFVRKFILPYMSDATWRHLKKDDYVGNKDKYLGRCREILKKIEGMQAVQARNVVEPEAEFFELPVFRIIFQALKVAIDNKDEHKIVIYLAPPGGGKSAVCNEIVRRYSALKIIVMPSWKYGCYAPYTDVCLSLKLPGPWRSTKDAEGDMFQELKENPRLLVFDEADSLGPEALNMIKMITNLTRCPVFITTLPALFDQMQKKSWYQSYQVLRRAETIDLEDFKISPRDVVPFLTRFNINGAKDKICDEFAEAANAFGGFDLIKRAADQLDSIVKRGSVTVADAQEAISVVAKLWRLDKRAAIQPAGRAS